MQARNTPTQPDRQEDQRGTPTVLRLALGNHTNCCYMNSLVQALLWTVYMVHADGATLGRAHSFFTALQQSHTTQPKYLMRDLTWRMLMSGWAESHRQHDVVEFTAFLLQHWHRAHGMLGDFTLVSHRSVTRGSALSRLHCACQLCHRGLHLLFRYSH